MTDMMQEAFIHLPITDNDGVGLEPERRRIENNLIQLFGGYTRATCEGAWHDPQTGKVYREGVLRYSIAGVWGEYNADQLGRIAAKACRIMRQECIYMSVPGFGVSFVGPDVSTIAMIAAE